MVNDLFSQLSVLGSSLALVFGLFLLWRRHVHAYVTAFAWQSAVLAGVAVLVAHFSGDTSLYVIAGLIFGLKVVAIPALLRIMARRFGDEHELQPYLNVEASLLVAAVTVNNVGLMWVAIEATTIFSAVLIPLRVSKSSVEASWKYILIGSVGIALAFVGTVLAYFDFVQRAGAAEQALNWTVLIAAAPNLHPQLMRLAFVFLLVGYGTKAGLAPMHTWLPDAHSEAPASLSAMMSGVLLAVALYAIMRWKAVVDLTLGSSFTNELLIGLGLFSLVIAGFSLVAQRNYKRMLAYSSIEHTGLTCIGLGFGPLGIFAALLHLVNHSLIKSAMFLLSGRLYRRYGTTSVSSVSGLLRTMPWTGGLFAAGMLAVIGLPPFGLFISEFALLRAGFAAGHGILMAIVLALLVLVFVSLVAHLNGMLYGAPAEALQRGEDDIRALIPLALCLALVVALGLMVPAPLARLLTMSAEIVAR